jgi:hypothetical protein
METRQPGIGRSGDPAGLNQAFGLMAGRCSAAQAVAIRRLRNDKLYRSLTDKWADFVLDI